MNHDLHQAIFTFACALAYLAWTWSGCPIPC